MSGVMTTAKLKRAIRSGYGTGRAEAYQSWIRIRRKLSSPVSNLHSHRVAIYSRPLQLLSGLEFAAANVAVWLGVSEIREQHPFWPEPHGHPAGGVHPELDRRLEMVPGLLEIARDAGIKHGVYPGTNIPFVATIDFTLGVGPWHANRLVHWSCKPRALLNSAPNRARMHERIQLERLYSNRVGATHVLIDGTQFTPTLLENLDWLMPLHEDLLSMRASDRLEDFAAAFMERAGEASIEIVKLEAARRVGLRKDIAEKHFRAAAWLGLIDIDLTQPVLMSRPIKLGKNLKKRMQRTLLGGAV